MGKVRTVRWHVEKLGFGLALLLLAGLCWQAMQTKPYKKSPRQLEDLARQVESEVDQADPRGKLPRVETFEVRPDPPELARQKIMLRGGPILPPPPRRGPPRWLVVQELQVMGQSRGPIFVKADPPPAALRAEAPAPQPQPDQVVRGRTWAVITGIVPWAAQRKAMGEGLYRFGAKVLPGDRLEYVGFQVERAEVTGEGASKLRWQRLDLHKSLAEVARWPKFAPEVVQAEALLPQLVHPLPPRADVDWTFEEAGHFKFRPAGGEPPPDEDEDEAANPRVPLPRLEGDAIGFGGDRPRAHHVLADPVEEKVLADRFFRFIDFTAAAGRSYRYRVRLVARNPNFGVAAKLLLDPSWASQEFAFTPWSEPTDPVRIPPEVDLYLGPVHPASPSADPRAQLLVRAWLPQEGITGLFHVKRITLGQVLHFRSAELTGRSPDGRRVVKHRADVATDQIVLWMEGGGLLRHPYRAREHGRLLLVGSGGRLTVLHEEADRKEFAGYLQTLKHWQAEAERGGPADPFRDLYPLPQREEE